MTARDHLLETIRNHAAGVGPLVTPTALNAAIDNYRAKVLTTAADLIRSDARHIRYGSATDYAERHANLLMASAREAAGA
jgi:hypothetical protein